MQKASQACAEVSPETDENCNKKCKTLLTRCIIKTEGQVAFIIHPGGEEQLECPGEAVRNNP